MIDNPDISPSIRLIQICRNAGMGLIEARELVFARDTLTLRDQFAIGALAAGKNFCPDETAEQAYKYADSMLRAREK